jgi:hypothetical protein
MPSDKTKRSLYATEAVAGAGLAAAAASDRVPEVVNSAVRLKRKGDLWHAETRYKADLGKTPEGNYVPARTITLKRPPKPAPVLMRDGKTAIDFGVDRRKPRVIAREKVKQEYLRANRRAKGPNHVPFPEGTWQSDPVTGKKITRMLDPKTKKMVRTPAALGELRRFAVVGAGVPLGIAAGWHGAHKYMGLKDKQVKRRQARKSVVLKRLSQSDVDGAIAGGLTGAAAYQAPSFTEWAGRGKGDAALTPKQREIRDAWKAEYKVHGAQKGMPKWKKAYRNYPKELPKAGMRRLQAHIYVGKTGMALTALAGAGGAAAGVPVMRAINRKFGDKK